MNIRALIAECEMLMVISSHDLTRVDGGWPSYVYYLIVHFAAGTLNQFSGKAPMLCTRPPPKLHKIIHSLKGSKVSMVMLCLTDKYGDGNWEGT